MKKSRFSEEQIIGFLRQAEAGMSIKELCRRWQPEVAKAFAKEAKHTALADVYEAIDELRHYRQRFLRVDAD